MNTQDTTSTRYTVDVQEEWRPIGQFTKITFHVIDTEDHDREIAVFPDGMHQDAYELAADLNNGAPEPTPVEVRSRIRYADEVKGEREAWGFDKQELVAATKNVRSAWAPYYEAIGKLACNNDVMYFEVVLWDEQGRAFAEHAQYNARRKEV